jgi:hypothetical protein
VNIYLRLQLTCLLLSAICCCRLCLFRFLLDACPFCFLQYTALPAFCNCSLFFFFYSSYGEWPSPALWWSVPLKSHHWNPCLLQAHWGRWCHSCLLWTTCLFTVHMRKCPSPTLRSSGHPAFFAMCVFFFLSCLFIIQFGFFLFCFLWVGVSLSRGLC